MNDNSVLVTQLDPWPLPLSRTMHRHLQEEKGMSVGGNGGALQVPFRVMRAPTDMKEKKPRGMGRDATTHGT